LISGANAMKTALTFLVFLLLANGAIAQPPARQPLAVQIAGTPIEPAGLRISLSFHNPNTVPMRLWIGFTPLDGYPRGDWFRMNADGRPVAYVGPLAKRRAPAAEEFHVLSPGEVRTATMSLIGLYDLPRGKRLAIRFEAYNPSVRIRRCRCWFPTRSRSRCLEASTKHRNGT
jgi:peptidyl-Lys metalloendopeptidase